MKVLVAGSRGFHGYEFLKKELDLVASRISITEIISGGAIGVDTLAERWAKENNILITQFLPEYDLYSNPKIAPIMRNKKMAMYCEVAVIFWDGQSNGTKNMILELKKREKKVKVIDLTERQLDLFKPF